MSTSDRSQNSFLIRIKGGTKFRGTKPYIITCLDNDISTELHRTRAIDGARYVAWNEAFVIDISDFCASADKQPEYLTFVFIDASKTGVSSLGYVQLELQNLRSSELEEVTENILDGKGTITFSTMPVAQPQSAFSQYAEKIKGYFAAAFDGKSSSETDGAAASSEVETVYEKTVGAAKGVAAAVAGAAHSKLSPSHDKEKGKSGDEEHAVGEEEQAGDEASAAAPSRLSTMQGKLYAGMEHAREGIAHAAEKIRPDETGDGSVGDGAANASGSAGAAAAESAKTSRFSGLQDKLHTTVEHAKEGISQAAEKLKAGEKGEGGVKDEATNASAAAAASGTQTRSGLGALSEKLHTTVEHAKEGISQAAEKLKAGEKDEGGVKDEAASASAAAAASGTQTQSGLSALREKLHTTVEHTKEGIAQAAVKMKAGDERAGAESAGAEGGGSTPSRLSAIGDMLHSTVEQGKEGISQTMRKIRPGHNSVAEGNSEWPKEDGKEGEDSGGPSRLEAIGDMFNSAVHQTVGSLARVAERFRSGDLKEVEGNNDEQQRTADKAADQTEKAASK